MLVQTASPQLVQHLHLHKLTFHDCKVNQLEMLVNLAYKTSMEKELKDQRIAVMLTPSELKAVDDWSFDRRIRSRGEAIRQLIDAGLKIPSLASDLTYKVIMDSEFDDPALKESAKKLEIALVEHFENINAAANKNVMESIWLERLTKNERSVIEALNDGKTAKEIAHTLGISEETTKWFIIGVRQKIASIKDE